MKLWFKNNWKMLLFFGIIFLIRFAFSFSPSHIDVRTQTEWGKWMYENNTTKGFYSWNVWECVWPNHPPLISWLYFEAYKIHSLLMWWMSNLGNFIALNHLGAGHLMFYYKFVQWFGEAKYGLSEYLIGVMIVIKQIMVFADFIVAWIIYKVANKNGKNWKKYVLSYLLLPFSWYLSAVWGQSDQLSFLFLIVSFILLTSNKSILSPLIYAIAINLKPNCVILLPLYIFIWFKQKQPFKNLVLGGLLAGVFSLWTVSWFTNGNLLELLSLLSKRLNTAEGLVTLNAFNFWGFLYPFPSKIVFDTTRYWFFTAKIFGWFVSAGLILFSFKFIKYKKIETIFWSIFVSGFGCWLFMTGMHERYSFFAIVALLFYSIYQKQYFKYFVFLSIIYFLSMFYVFSVPQQLDGIKTIFNFGKQLIPRLLSLINLFIYFWLILKNSRRNKLSIK